MRRLLNIIQLSLALVASAAPLAAAQGTFLSRTFVASDGVRVPYTVFVPAHYTKAKSWPVLVAIHGGGERGTDGALQLTHGVAPVVRKRPDAFPAIIVFPQVADRVRGPVLSAQITGLLDQVMRDYRIDPLRQYVTGFSFGGFLTYDIAYRNPGRFAALVPVAAYIVPGWAADDTLRPPPLETLLKKVGVTLTTTPIWAFHGDHDEMVPIARARLNAVVLKELKVPIRFTEIPNGRHGIWDKLYEDQQLWDWLFKQKRTPKPAAPK